MVDEFDAWANASAVGGYGGSAEALFTEDLTITFFGGTGYGFAQPALTTQGSGMEFGSEGSGTASLGGCNAGWEAGSYCLWNSVPFEFGVPDSEELTLNAGASAFGDFVATAAWGEASFDGFAYFYDTSGDPLSGVSYEISSDEQFIPEPGRLLLTAMAGAALLACGRRQKRR